MFLFSANNSRSLSDWCQQCVYFLATIVGHLVTSIDNVFRHSFLYCNVHPIDVNFLLLRIYIDGTSEKETTHV